MQLEDNTKETDQIKRLTHGTKDIVDSCYRHSRHFDAPTDEFTRLQNEYDLAYNVYNSNLDTFHEDMDSDSNLDTSHEDLVGTILTNRKNLFDAGLSFLDALDTRLNSLRTAQQTPPEVTAAQQFARGYRSTPHS